MVGMKITVTSVDKGIDREDLRAKGNLPGTSNKIQR